jgi:hypothetical protein
MTARDIVTVADVREFIASASTREAIALVVRRHDPSALKLGGFAIDHLAGDVQVALLNLLEDVVE